MKIILKSFKQDEETGRLTLHFEVVSAEEALHMPDSADFFFESGTELFKLLEKHHGAE